MKIRIIREAQPSMKAVPDDPVIFHWAGWSDEEWWCRCWKCGHSAGLADHVVTISGDIVNIEPSLICPNGACVAHYHIRNGEIVQA